ncbi:hypothetical protein [Candidatus Nitrosotalea okcheonensis]|uniref:Uncharacterized protein n=1 Tax=Candidatus Nitrosotalea okcheonensis TaxID=1903276 RepID=A0A2H1FDD7_9ARCH|nr:hypothetical protein [Candidatus Nitrosotalea okcheonensis]SMH70774.1 protein of unknown function [Candidatus Nitrosotalea okcheonensis]
MKLKNDATARLIKMSESVREEITRDVLDTFGIDLSNQELVYHDKTKLVWTQQIRDNSALKQELDSFLSLVKNNVEHLPEMIKFEKEYPGAIEENNSHDSISYDLEFLWICESHVKKFEKERYLPQNEISRYGIRIQELKDKIRHITIDNLQK